MNDPLKDEELGMLAMLLGAAALLLMALTARAADLSPQTKASIELGRALFYDTRTSQDNNTSCGSCHQPRYGGTDGRALAVGRIGSPGSPTGLIGTRRSQPIINASLVELMQDQHMFYDHRALDPYDQAIQPFSNPIEMGNQSAQQVANRMGSIAGYQKLCQDAFGDPQLTPQRMRESLVNFQRAEWVAIKTPLGDYLAGKDQALPPRLARGAETFKKACATCHVPPLFTGGRCFNDGYAYRFDPNDQGKAKTTNSQSDLRAYKTPGLIEVKLRGTWGHTGAWKSLREVIEHYNAGGRFVINGDKTREYLDPIIDNRVRRLNLTKDQMDELEACLSEGTIPYEPVKASPPKEFPG